MTWFYQYWQPFIKNKKVRTKAIHGGGDAELSLRVFSTPEKMDCGGEAIN